MPTADLIYSIAAAAGFPEAHRQPHAGLRRLRGQPAVHLPLGHLRENDRAHIFVLHFATQQRLKLWGRARIVEGDLELMERLVDPAYRARPQRAIAFTIEAWDINCRQHIVPRYSEAEIAPAVDNLARRIKELWKKKWPA